jgi:hypothetical protein
MGFGVFTFYHDPNVEGQFTLALPNVPKCTFIQVKRSSKAHFIRGNKSAQVGCWQIGKILCQKSALCITRKGQAPPAHYVVECASQACYVRAC